MARTQTATNSSKTISTKNGTAPSTEDKGVYSKAVKAAEAAKKRATNTAKKAATSAAETAESVADSAVAETRSQVENVAETGIDRTEHFFGSIGRAAKAASESLQEDGLHRSAAYVDAAAQGLNRAATEVDGIDASKIGSRVENIVRSNPLLTMGLLAVAGFALAGAVKRKNQA